MKRSKTKNKYPKQYLSGLSKKDKEKQKRSLNKARRSYDKERGSKKYVDRPKLKSYKNKESGWTAKFHKLYPNAKTLNDIAKVTGIPKGALQAVIKKGKGAYYSSGSRPNQTAESWGKARMYSYILGGKTRKIDNHITEEYNVKFKHKSQIKKGGYTKKETKKKDSKKRDKKESKKKKRLKKSKGSIKRKYKHTSDEWTSENSECPKTPSHQLHISKKSSHWVKVDVKNEIYKDDDSYIIDNKSIGTGLYIMIVLKQDPDTLYLLKEFDDLFSFRQIEYPEAPLDRGMIGHSSIFTEREFSMEWEKEKMAREFEQEASLLEDKKRKANLFKKAEQARNQCLIYYAGQLYYDRGIVLWTNHSGHFQPKEEHMDKVGLPKELFVPMGSKKINEIIRRHTLDSPPVSPDVSISPTTSPKTKMSKFLSLIGKK